MISTLYFIPLLSGLWALGSCESHQFIVVKVDKNWVDAQSYCREHYTDLATIQSQEEMDSVKAAVDGETGNFWIGLSMKNNKWVWSDGRSLSYSYWNYGEPSHDAPVVCVMILIFNQGRWNDAGCDWTGPFVCYKKIPLVLVKENKTWWEALNYCRQNRMDLLSVHDQVTQGGMEMVIKNVTTPHMWMGLRFTCAQRFWFWVSGSSVCYQNWAVGNGTGEGDCSSGDRSGAVEFRSKQWVSLPDTLKLNFICVIVEDY